MFGFLSQFHAKLISHYDVYWSTVKDKTLNNNDIKRYNEKQSPWLHEGSPLRSDSLLSSLARDLSRRQQNATTKGNKNIYKPSRLVSVKAAFAEGRRMKTSDTLAI